MAHGEYRTVEVVVVNDGQYRWGAEREQLLAARRMMVLRPWS
jgi:hypothetical protein